MPLFREAGRALLLLLKRFHLDTSKRMPKSKAFTKACTEQFLTEIIHVENIRANEAQNGSSRKLVLTKAGEAVSA